MIAARTTQDDVMDVMTTSVGRGLIRDCYSSFFRHVRFAGRFRLVVVIDPTYGVTSTEIEDTIQYLELLPSLEPAVAEVVIDRLPVNVGLQRALLMLFSHSKSQFGLHLEDDWRFFGDFDLDGLCADLASQNATMIAFGNTHAAKNGTFERADECEPVAGTRVPLVRLVTPSWASDYLPLCPHLHDARRWIPAYVRALMLDDHPARCPDERVKEYVRRHRLTQNLRVLWTKDIVVEEIGRAWAAARGIAKNIAADAEREPVALAAGDPLELARSRSYKARANRVIAGETQTFMKRPMHFAPGEFPFFLDRGDGPYVWDVDGNAYIDFIAGLGACGLGHAPPLVTNAVNTQLSKGVLASLPTLAEIEASEALLSVLPFADRVRFFKTGADACSTAVRVARAHTGRSGVASCGYHGFHDLFMQGTPGVPASDKALHEFDPFSHDGPGSLQHVLNRHSVACVIMALPYVRCISPDRLQVLAGCARAAGALLVMDEVVTGFRLSLAGASGLFDLQPDMVCLGKSLAAGLPLAAVAGRAEIMDLLADLHVSTTYGGETLSLAVATAVVGHYSSTHILARMHALGRRFANGANRLAEQAQLAPIVHGYDPMPCFSFGRNPEEHVRLGRLFQAICCRHGVLFRRDVNFITAAHGESEIDRALEAVAFGVTAVASAGHA